MTLRGLIWRATADVATVTRTSALCLVVFGLGVYAGALIGDFSKRMEFCNDTSSSRYILDDKARVQSCNHPRSATEIERDEALHR